MFFMCLFKFDRNNILSFFFHKVSSLSSLSPSPPLILSTIKKIQQKTWQTLLVLFPQFSLYIASQKVYTTYYHTNKFLTLFHICDNASAYNCEFSVHKQWTVTAREQPAKKNIYQIYLFCHSCLSSLKLNSLQPTLSLVHIFFSCSHCHQDSFFSVVLLVIYELSIRLEISLLFTLHILQNKLSLPLSCRCKPIWCLLDKQEKM